MSDSNATKKTEQWIESIVIGLNFCPFAKREIRKNAVRYVLTESTEMADVLAQLMEECAFLDGNPATETTLLILPVGFEEFYDYLELHALAEDLLEEHDYEGVYQIASFHPDYCFADADSDDAANYTNRSPYPMLHLLREASLESAIDNYPDIDSIPETNMQKARGLGVAYFQSMLKISS